MSTNTFAKLGLVFVVVGAVALSGPVFGFSTLAADRDLNVATAEDPDGYLGIHDNSGSSDSDVKKNGPGEVFYLDDNVGSLEASDIDVTNVLYDGSQSSLDGDVVTNGGEHDFTVQISCGDSNLKDPGEITVQLDVSGDVAIELDRTTDQTVDVKCRGNGNTGGGDVVAKNPSTGGNSDELTFDLENEGEGELKVHGIAVDDTTTDATEIENDGPGNPAPIEFGGTDTKANVVEIGGGEYDLRGKEKIGAGESVSVGIYGFQNDAGEPVSVSGEDVTISLYGSNGRIDQVTVSVPE